MNTSITRVQEIPRCIKATESHETRYSICQGSSSVIRHYMVRGILGSLLPLSITSTRFRQHKTQKTQNRQQNQHSLQTPPKFINSKHQFRINQDPNPDIEKIRKIHFSKLTIKSYFYRQTKDLTPQTTTSHNIHIISQLGIFETILANQLIHTNN